MKPMPRAAPRNAGRRSFQLVVTTCTTKRDLTGANYRGHSPNQSLPCSTVSRLVPKTLEASTVTARAAVPRWRRDAVLRAYASDPK